MFRPTIQTLSPHRHPLWESGKAKTARAHSGQARASARKAARRALRREPTEAQIAEGLAYRERLTVTLTLTDAAYPGYGGFRDRYRY